MSEEEMIEHIRNLTKVFIKRLEELAGASMKDAICIIDNTISSIIVNYLFGITEKDDKIERLTHLASLIAMIKDALSDFESCSNFIKDGCEITIGDRILGKTKKPNVH